MVNKMRIVFVSAVSTKMNTSSSIRNVALINGLLMNGHSILLIEPVPKMNSIFYDDLMLEHASLTIIPLNGNNIYSSATKMNTSNKAIWFIRKILRSAYHKLIIIKGPRYHIKTDLLNRIRQFECNAIISSSDPKTSHIIARDIIAKLELNGVEWIQYWGDPITIDVTSKSLIPKFLAKMLEGNILKKANKIVYTSPITSELQKEIFNQYKSKMRYVPTPFFKSLSQIENQESVIENKVHTVGYFGNYESSVRNIMPLYSAISRNKDLKLIISGFSDVVLIECANVEINPRANRKTIENLEIKSDLLIVLLNHNGTQIPGKIYHYAGTSKPILVIMDGENSNHIKHEFEKYERYYFCNNDVNSISSAIIDIINDNKSFHPLDEFSSEKVAKLFEKIIGED